MSHQAIINRITQQLHIQSGSHPDLTIRFFFQAAHHLIQQGQTDYLEMINTVYRHRPNIAETHFINLWIRSIQYHFRNNHKTDYLNFKYLDWLNYLNHDGLNDIPVITELLKTQNTATHIPSRYRSLHTALRFIHHHNPSLDLKIADVGCCLGLGLQACLIDGFLNSPPFEDKTPDHQLIKFIESPVGKISKVLGLDIKIPSVEWVKACNYLSRYEDDGRTLDSIVSFLAPSSGKLSLIESSITDNNLPYLLTQTHGFMTVIYSSMTLYELSDIDQQAALTNINLMLQEGGVFIEFTFIDPHDWFKGVQTTVRQKLNSNLSPPLVWHLWNDSRCSCVTAGKDYDKVNQTLSLLGNYNDTVFTIPVSRKTKSSQRTWAHPKKSFQSQDRIS